MDFKIWTWIEVNWIEYEGIGFYLRLFSPQPQCSMLKSYTLFVARGATKYKFHACIQIGWNVQGSNEANCLWNAELRDGLLDHLNEMATDALQIQTYTEPFKSIWTGNVFQSIFFEICI